MMNALIQIARNAGPYLVIELLLPGGSVIALLLWLFRHRFTKGAPPLGMSEIGRRSWIQSFASRFSPHLSIRRLMKVWRAPRESYPDSASSGVLSITAP